MSKATEGTTKGTIYRTVDPDFLIMQTDSTGPFYDPRHDLPIKEEMVANIVALGVRQPIEVSKFEDKHYIVEGRQRYKHWKEALKQWKKMGEEPKPLSMIILNTKPNDGEMIAVACNEHRQDDSILLKMEKACRLLTLGHSDEVVANTFGIKVQQLENWKKGDSLCAPVKKMVEAGKITITAASKFASLPAAEQKEKVQELIDSGAKPTVKNAEKKVNTKKDKEENKAWTKATLMDLADMADTPPHFRAFIKLVLGEMPMEDAVKVEGLEWIQK